MSNGTQLEIARTRILMAERQLQRDRTLLRLMEIDDERQRHEESLPVFDTALQELRDKLVALGAPEDKSS